MCERALTIRRFFSEHGLVLYCNCITGVLSCSKPSWHTIGGRGAPWVILPPGANDVLTPLTPITDPSRHNLLAFYGWDGISIIVWSETGLGEALQSVLVSRRCTKCDEPAAIKDNNVAEQTMRAVRPRGIFAGCLLFINRRSRCSINLDNTMTLPFAL